MENVKLGQETAAKETNYNDMPPSEEVVDDLPF
jgi:hypothetical protein